VKANLLNAAELLTIYFLAFISLTYWVLARNILKFNEEFNSLSRTNDKACDILNTSIYKRRISTNNSKAYFLVVWTAFLICEIDRCAKIGKIVIYEPEAISLIKVSIQIMAGFPSINGDHNEFLMGFIDIDLLLYFLISENIESI
jgi:hypothetical protein